MCHCQTDVHSSNSPHSWASGFTQQGIAQLIGDPRYRRFNVLIREDAKANHLLMSV